MARRKKPKSQRPNVTRDRLRTIREVEGWRVAADAAGVRKTKKVTSKSGKTYYRPLTDKQRRDRLQIRITGYSRGSVRPGGTSERVGPADLPKRVRERIKGTLAAIPEEDRVKAGYRLDRKERIRKLRTQSRAFDEVDILSNTAREEMAAAQAEIDREIDSERQALNDAEGIEEMWANYRRAQETGDLEDWELFRNGDQENNIPGYEAV